jgi:hypothetical protein
MRRTGVADGEDPAVSDATRWHIRMLLEDTRVADILSGAAGIQPLPDSHGLGESRSRFSKSRQNVCHRSSTNVAT